MPKVPIITPPSHCEHTARYQAIARTKMSGPHKKELGSRQSSQTDVHDLEKGEPIPQEAALDLEVGNLYPLDVTG